MRVTVWIPLCLIIVLYVGSVDGVSSRPCNNAPSHPEGYPSDCDPDLLSYPAGYACTFTCPTGYVRVSGGGRALCNNGRWTGNDLVCEEINECASSPCENGGTCADLVNGYTCTCAPGYDGVNCETDVDECASTPCQNGGICDDEVNGYTCTCAPGYDGDHCHTDVDECASNPCQNGGTCEDNVNGYTCTCAPGYDGDDCETDVDECASAPCQNGGTCEDMVNGYTCTCAPGYEGDDCETGKFAIMSILWHVDECASVLCQNGGTCEDRVNGYTCNCAPGYEGDDCETDVDECASSPCQNGGTCEDEVNGYTCTCAPGYDGDDCETDVDECASAPCQNGGTCEDRVNGYTCTCIPGYEGDDCETDVNECASAPCQNGGTCKDEVNGYTCTCAPGYEGDHCQTDVDECFSAPCQNGGTCENIVNGYTCTCAPGFEGDNCEMDVDECASAPCQNGGACADEVNGYTCTCVSGYGGDDCETDVDECASAPCQNGGNCLDQVNGYTCTCPTGYNGVHCETGRAVCRAWGDPHYYPFDGGAHHFQGPCRYILAEDCGNSSDFTVTAQNVPIWPGASISVVREVYVEAHGFVVGIQQGRLVTVGGVPHTLPLSLAGGTVEVSLSGRFVRVLLSNFSVEVVYDGSHEVKVVVPADYWGRMRGLCGNYNGDTSDDYMTPDGTIVGDWNTFGDSWLTDPATCPGGQQLPPPPRCNDAVQAAAESADNCGLLKNPVGPFGVCIDIVDPEPFFTSCVFDMCWNGNTIGLCQNLEAYVEACRTAGVHVVPFSWRTEARCPVVCPPNSQYSTCTSYCPATCPNPNAEEQCLLGCGEGCKCNPGFIRSGQECVPEEQCGCTDDEGRYYMIGETSGVGCDRICTCVSTDKIECREVQCDVNAWCGVYGGREGCHCNHGYNGDGTSCEPAS
ncbi:fibropellin-1-like [Branchiostoma floridae]|uniref:Fibropellin-1-like n=1 Tax=Branchiostoma floridae TaxID=7739 RepID=A0A9J7MGI1_BRAFL|nr:fibropellin-1-like [Branchiostoma floridae]